MDIEKYQLKELGFNNGVHYFLGSFEQLLKEASKRASEKPKKDIIRKLDFKLILESSETICQA